MAGSTKQPYFCHGDWPLTSNSQVTGDHFEDLRKLCFAVMNPETGHVQDTWLGAGLTPESELPTAISADDYGVGEIIIKTSRTKLWTTREAVSLGCWRSISLDGDTYEALTDLTTGENTTSPDSSANWRKITTPPALVYTNSVAREWDGGVPTGTGFPMPDVHPAAGIWMSNSSSNTSNGWVILRDFNKYHDWDFNSLCRYADNRDGDDGLGGSTNYDWNLAAHKFLPLQVESKERNKPWVYQGDKDEDFLSRKYRFQSLPDKQNWKKEGITEPIAMGAIFSTYAKLANEGDYGVNQYWIDNGLPNAGMPWSTAKLCDSIQSVIEHLSSNRELCWPVDETYIDNWEAVNDDTWDLAMDACEAFPSVEDEYWGCNGSGFELLLKKLGSYDWYFDTANIYIPESIQIYIEETENTEAYNPPVGTWRRTWSHTMNRVEPAFMRSYEMTAPTSSGAFNIWDGSNPATISALPWSGIFIDTLPAVTSYETTHITDTISDLTEYSFVIDAEITLPIGANIRIAESGEDDLMTWVVNTSISGGQTYVKVSHSLTVYSTALTIYLNENIIARHDPIKIEFNPESVTPYPKYKLDYRMLQHCYDILLKCIYIKTPAEISRKQITQVADGDSSPGTNGNTRMHGVFPYFQSHIASLWAATDDDDWQSTPPTSGSQWIARWNCQCTETYTEIDDVGEWSINNGCYVTELRFALKLDGFDQPELEPERVRGNLIAKNSAYANLYVEYGDRQADNPNSESSLYLSPDFDVDNGNAEMSCTASGLTSEVYAYGSSVPPSKYGILATSINPDTWTPVAAGFVGYGQSDKYVILGLHKYDPTGDDFSQDFEGHGSIGFTRQRDYVVYQLDFDLIPSTVFIDSGGRDRIGAQEPAGAPEADINPPKPDPAQINIMPALEWSRILIGEEETDTEHPNAGYYWRLSVNVTACLAEDLEGSDPVQYKAIIIPASSETVPTDTYGTSATCTVKLFDDIPEEEAIGKNYTYTGTPIKLDADGDIISSGDTTTPVVSWRYNVSHGGALHEGDSVYFPAGVSGSEDDGEEYEVVNIDSSSSFDIAKTTQPTSVTDLSIWDVSGYNLADWQAETAYGWTVKVITKDDENNETNPSDAEAIEVAADWPLDLYLAETFQDRSGYLEALE